MPIVEIAEPTATQPHAAPVVASTKSPTNLAYALAWARRGFAVFPLQENGKVPLPGSSGHLAGTTDPEEIRALWTDPLTGSVLPYNIGASPRDGRHLVVDLDVKDGRDGIAAYKALGGEIAGLVVRTPTGGLHVYTRGEDLCTTAGEIAEGVDSRGMDGYVVAPGSTIDGVEYAVIEDGKILPCPQFVVDAIGTRAERTRLITRYAVESDLPWNVARAVTWAQVAPAAVTGCWHDYGYRLGCEMARIGLSPEKTIEVLEDHWKPRGEGFKSQAQFERDVLGGYHDAVRDGEHGRNALADAREMFGDVTPAPPDAAQPTAPVAAPAGRSKYRLRTMAECKEVPAREYLIEGLLARGDVGLVIADPGVGKSVLGPHISGNVALGRPVFGRATEAGRVLYVPGEDRDGIANRFRAIEQRHGNADPNFYLVEGMEDFLSSTEDADALYGIVQEHRPALVVLDTLASLFPGMAENENEAMAKVIALARRISAPTGDVRGPAVLVLCHPSKADPSKPRGHTSLNGAADVSLILTKNPQTKVVGITLGKNRNGTCDCEPMAFRIEPETIGIDAKGKPITAPIAVEMSAGEVETTKALNESEVMALGLLSELIDERARDVIDGQTQTIDGVCLAGLTGISEDAWRDRCESRGLSRAKTRDARTKTFHRARMGLIAKQRIKCVLGTVFEI